MAVSRKPPGIAETARLFAHGGSQAVRLPKAFRFEGQEVSIRREGDAVILEPVRKRATTQADLDAMWARIDALDDPNDPFPDPPRQSIDPIIRW
ncbi:antitoxin [Brevundimonas staleyi]|uniref:Antitoxin n=1 Tax=Brevundimonas staleyi TaxID=74326 RepID=A0ABW0FV63_9CAUL